MSEIWHDLRENPEDLPHKSGIYWAQYESGEFDYVKFSAEKDKWLTSWNIIAWKSE